MIKRFLLFLFLGSALLAAGCKATAHGGNCGCPKFGQVKKEGQGAVSAEAHGLETRGN